MGVIFKTDRRLIIPRWRSFEIALFTGELDERSTKKGFGKFINLTSLAEQKQAWEKNNDLSHAGDLLSSAFVLGIESEFIHVAKFILQKEPDFSSPIAKLASKILGIKNNISEVSSHINNNNKIENIADSFYYSEIRKLKSYIKRENRNPIAWIELGRLYTLVGNVQKANRCVDAALFLDKNNRFIVRSASRFYHHFHSDKDFALQIIKKSEHIKNDPWLLSAEIAYSGVLDRHSKMAKVGVEFLKNNQNSLATTELASALGTLEFTNGKVRDAKKYFNLSLEEPNDNSIAQVSWVTENINGFYIDKSKYNVPLAFEARAHEFYANRKFDESYESALRWYKDEPFSSRPVNLASYVAGIFLDKKLDAIELIKRGLKSNPKDAMLINNLIYFLVQADLVKEANKVFADNIINDLESQSEISLISLSATAGLLLFRNGEIERGREYYQKALTESKKERNPYLIALATANYALEEIRIAKDKSELGTLINQVDVACKNNEEPDVKIIYKKVLAEYNNLELKL